MPDATTIVILTNPDFYSALFGFLGTVLIFFFGLPSRIDPEGAMYIILEQTNHKEKMKAKRYQATSYLGLSLISLSFLIQVIKITLNTL
jgi:hypothetical protein